MLAAKRPAQRGRQGYGDAAACKIALHRRPAGGLGPVPYPESCFDTSGIVIEVVEAADRPLRGRNPKPRLDQFAAAELGEDISWCATGMTVGNKPALTVTER